MAKGDPENGDRVRRTDTGQAATYVQLHLSKGHGCHDVLLDDGPKEVTPWDLDTPLEVTGRPQKCPRCGHVHHPFYCQETRPHGTPGG